MKTNKGLIFFASSCLLLFAFLLLIVVEPNVCQKQARTFQAPNSPKHGAPRTFHHKPTRHRRHRTRPSTRNSPSNTVRVHTKIGEIEGLVMDVNGKRVHAFLGVPFAEPPIGPLRFKPPVPTKPHPQVIRADKPAKSCYQSGDYEYQFRGADMWNAKTEKSEDCLYMNIWVPADSVNTTVMVWLFGGGFWYGSASLDIYHGLGLAAEGRVIVVTPNYRLGAFGFLFLDHAEVPGNMGLLDQQMALRWIQENIAAFNGDPNRVNLFGESAGAASIVAHMVAPESWPLFHNGILQSGTLDNPWSMDSPAKSAARSWTLVESAGCRHAKMADTAKCLRNKTAAELDTAMWSITNNYLEFPLVIVSRDRGGFFRRDAYESLRQGRYRPKTDLMFGINQDEGTFWMAYYDLKQYFHPFNNTGGGDEKLINASRFSESVNNVILKNKPHVYKSAALWEYRDAQPCPPPTDNPAFYRDQLNQLIGDYFFTCDSVWLADDVVKRNMGKVYIYHFEQRISSNPWPRWMGVMHGYEIEYIFGLPLLNHNHHQSFVAGYNNGKNNNYYNYTPEDRVFSKDVIQYWTSFAKTGIPKAKSRKPEWPQYKLDEKAWYVLKARNTGPHALYKQKESECKLWRSIRDIEYQLYEAKMSGATITSFHVHTLLSVTMIGYLLSNVMAVL